MDNKRTSSSQGTFLKNQEDYRDQVLQVGIKLVDSGLKNVMIMILVCAVWTTINSDNWQDELVNGLATLIFGGLATMLDIFLLHKNLKVFVIVFSLLGFLTFVLITEAWIQKSPDQFLLSHEIILSILLTSLIKQMVLVSKNFIILSNAVKLSYYLFRNQYHYGHLLFDVKLFVPFFLAITIYYSDLHDKYVKKILQLCIRESDNMKKYFQSTLEIVPNGVLVINKEKSDIVFSNQVIQILFGAKESIQIKQCLSGFLKQKAQSEGQSPLITEASHLQRHHNHDFQNQALLISSLNASAKKKNLLEYLQDPEQQFQNKDDIFKNKELKKYIQVKVQLINNDSQLIVIINDVTRLKEIERMSQQMKSMFFASIAHELRTPLNTIIPMTCKLQKQPLDSKSLKYIEIIRSSSIFLQNIIEEALDMSRIENNKFQINLEHFDVRKTVDDVADIMGFQIEQKQLKLIIDVDSSVPSQVLSDQKRFQQILFNLIGNAIKFTFKGFIKVTLTYKDHYLTTEVEDSGIGIAQDQINKLFQFFGTIEKSRKINKGGMGFGLTICKMILQQLGGEIFVTSEYSKGTTFIFKLKMEQFNPEDNNNHHQLSSFQDMHQFEQQISGSAILQGSTNRNQMFRLESGGQFDQQRRSTANFRLRPNISHRNRNESLMEVPMFIESSEIMLNSPRITDNDTLNDKYVQFQERLFLSIRKNSFMNSSHTMSQEEINTNLIVAAIGKKFKVLVVDDQPYNLFVLKELLLDVQAIDSIETALNGQEAIEVMMSNIDSEKKCLFDYVLMDLHMPIMDGFQAIQKLRGMEQDHEMDLSGTIIIALSAITKNQFDCSQNSRLFSNFMEKPVSYEALIRLF